MSERQPGWVRARKSFHTSSHEAGSEYRVTSTGEAAKTSETQETGSTDYLALACPVYELISAFCTQVLTGDKARQVRGTVDSSHAAGLYICT